jgi:hypothetical protein
MGSEFTFYDFVEEQGENTVYKWLQEIPTGAKEKFDSRMGHLEATPRGQWRRPLVDTVTDRACDGLFEIRVQLKRRQYRILGAHNGREPNLLHCFVKPGAAVPQADCQRAHRNRELVVADPARHRVEHVYEQV